MKFAFIIMGNFDPAVDKAEIGGGKRQILAWQSESVVFIW